MSCEGDVRWKQNQQQYARTVGVANKCLQESCAREACEVKHALPAQAGLAHVRHQISCGHVQQATVFRKIMSEIKLLNNEKA